MIPSQKPSVALDFSISPELREELALHLHIAGSLDQSDWLVHDSSAETLDTAALEQSLAAGKTVLLLQPTAQQLDQVWKLTGIGTVEGMPAVAIRREARGSYGLITFPQGEIQAPSAKTASSPPSPKESPVKPALGPTLARHISRPRMAAMMMGDSGPTLYPPAGALFGTAVIYQELHGVGVTATNFGSTINPVAGQTQSADALAVNTFYVYWVNGAAQPYYLVILRQTIEFGAGKTLQNDWTGRGFAMSQGLTNLISPAVSTGQMFLTNTSPNTADVTASIVQPMQLSVRVPGGTAIQTFTATEGAQLPLDPTKDQWAVINNTDPVAGTSSWQFYQTAMWNPVSQPPFPGSSVPSDFNNDFIDGSSRVLVLPSISTGLLSVTTYSAWNMSDQQAVFSGQFNLGQQLYMVWYSNLNGVIGPNVYALPGGGMNVSQVSAMTPFSLNLSAVARQT